ncbi:Trm112 family protein [Desulfovibrio sp. OttesenSCG-928-M16]|nr:Trm112 family protein [Desulfovibrio sp. OttesenSCG-928-M16]
MDTSLLDILACPKCRGSLELLETGERSGLACEACAVVYPIEEDIPVLLVEEARPRAQWEAGAI